MLHSATQWHQTPDNLLWDLVRILSKGRQLEVKKWVEHKLNFREKRKCCEITSMFVSWKE